MKKILTVVSRQSKLAILQVGEVFNLLKDTEYKLISFESFGDKHKQISLLDGQVRADFFTKELDDFLLEEKADIAIHSAKDLPYPLPAGLEIIALTHRADNTDSLVCRQGLPYKSLTDMPEGMIIGTSSATRKKAILKQNPLLTLKGIRGTIEERIAQTDAGDFDAVIVATCALERLELAHRISERLNFDTHPLQGTLAIVAKKGREDLKALFKAIDARLQYGKVTLLGAGPGATDLMTLRGKQALATADVVYYDDLIAEETLQLCSHAKCIYVGKRKNRHSTEQGDINIQMVNSAYAGKKVVRLKGGDPMIFAHGGEEVEFLASNLIEVEVIPGISTANALAALCQIPLTHRDLASSLAFVSGHSLYGVEIPKVDTLVLYMAGTKIKSIASELIEQGWDCRTPVALVHNVSLPSQQAFYYTLETIMQEERPFPTPIIILVGQVVALKEKSAKDICNEPRVLVTGLDATPYRHLGKVIHTPLIEIQPLQNYSELHAQFNNLADYQYLLFTSRNTVRYFMEQLLLSGRDARCLAHLQIVSIGKTTSKALNEWGLLPNHQAKTADSHGVIDLFAQLNITGKVLVPRSDLALELIPTGLRKLGITVETVVAYANVMPEIPHRVDQNQVDILVLSSPSCVKNYIELYGVLPTEKQIIVRGITTFNYLEEIGFPTERVTSWETLQQKNTKL